MEFVDYTVHMGGFGQMFGVPNAVVDQYLKLSTPSQLKVLLYLLRHNGQQVEQSEISEALSVSDELVEEALLFWSQKAAYRLSCNAVKCQERGTKPSGNCGGSGKIGGPENSVSAVGTAAGTAAAAY